MNRRLYFHACVKKELREKKSRWTKFHDVISQMAKNP